jgi:hypothetical protein
LHQIIDAEVAKCDLRGARPLHREQLDFEGMVAKRLDSTYQRGRSRDWLKIKYADYSRPAALGFGRNVASA